MSAPPSTPKIVDNTSSLSKRSTPTMATRNKTAAKQVRSKQQLSPPMLERGISRIEDRIKDLGSFDITTVPEGSSAELTALSAAIKDTLERCFGEDTSAYSRYESAASLSWYPMVLMSGQRTPPQEFMTNVKRKIGNSVALLREAQRVLREDLEDAHHESKTSASVAPARNAALTGRVFVVHGHDGEAREMVARFLKNLGFDPIILHERPNQGSTIIEKFETNSDVDFAVVLLTPDDVGRGLKETELQPRARQNVLLELGYFIGHLGRGKVCALRRGDLELPSDYLGVVWHSMDSGEGWKLALARELKAAGHTIDLNMAFNS